MICTYVAEPAISDAEGIFMVIFFGIYFLIYGAIILLGITGYVFQGLGMYRIAERRGIHKPWLAWIPVANSWLLGSISDQYQYVVKQKVTRRRIAVLVLEIAMIVVYVAIFVSMFAMMFSMDSTTTAMDEISMLLVMLVGMLFLFGLAIAAMVFVYLSYFDLFRSCRPQNEVLFLILGIVVPITVPFFIFACSQYDLGMPPKRAPQEPGQIPPASAEETPAPEEVPSQEAPVSEEEIPAEESAEN
jgi:hypothetical protein